MQTNLTFFSRLLLATVIFGAAFSMVNNYPHNSFRFIFEQAGSACLYAVASVSSAVLCWLMRGKDHKQWLNGLLSVILASLCFLNIWTILR